MWRINLPSSKILQSYVLGTDVIHTVPDKVKYIYKKHQFIFIYSRLLLYTLHRSSTVPHAVYTQSRMPFVA